MDYTVGANTESPRTNILRRGVYEKNIFYNERMSWAKNVALRDDPHPGMIGNHTQEYSKTIKFMRRKSRQRKVLPEYGVEES